MLISADMVIIHHIEEAYFNCTHQTLEMFRFVAVDPLATHILKVKVEVMLHLSTTRAFRQKDRFPYIYDSSCCNLQADDDNFVRVELFLSQLSLLPRTRLHWGDIKVYQAERDAASRWVVTPAEWPPDEYPPFAGGENIVSIDLARAIVAGHTVQAWYAVGSLYSAARESTKFHALCRCSTKIQQWHSL